MTVDLLYLAKGRREFTETSAASLLWNTNWSLVRALHVYFDGEGNPPAARLVLNAPAKTHFHFEDFGGPVPIMLQHTARHDKAEYFAKIDNDVIVPPCWLEAACEVMESCDRLDLLGIEPPLSRTANPQTGKEGDRPDLYPITQYGAAANVGTFAVPLSHAPTTAVGGIGLFRAEVFRRFPDLKPHAGGRGGFTDWQLRHPEIRKGWITPPLDLFLLDRLPFDPWLSLSRQYEQEGIQRFWTRYTPDVARKLAGWWLGEKEATA